MGQNAPGQSDCGNFKSAKSLEQIDEAVRFFVY